jgi:two-component system response regulator HydG
MKKILVIDDDAFICEILQKHLQNNHFDVEITYYGANAIALFKKNNFDLVLCDFRLPDSSGLELMQKMKAINQEVPIIIMTAYADIKMAVKMIKMGATDYVAKPIQQEELISLINKLLDQKSKAPENISKGTSSFTNGDFIIGNSRKIKQVISLAGKVAPTDMSVIIDGETGVGKEYVARYIHDNSLRKHKPFVAVDCGAIPKDLANSELFGHVKGSFTGAVMDKNGVFQKADGGTLFLDEIGNLSYEVQLKLLRAVQERVIVRLGDEKTKKIDIRIIAATNNDLRNEVNDNTFREDLYHRLNEFSINLPPLRERKEDILVFVDHFISMSNQELNRNIVGLTAEAEEVILNYPWYGNLRELKNVIKRGVLMSDGEKIDTNCLPYEIIYPRENKSGETSDQTDSSSDVTLKSVSSEIEKRLIIKTIKEAGYNKSEAARLLKIDRKTLYNKIKIYDIKI